MIRPDQLFNSPIPGQSLTEDPASASPWEMPPKFSATGPALDHLLRTIMNPKFMKSFNLLFKEDKKFFVDRIAAQMLQEGFLNGLWTVDMMLLLVEPLVCMLVWLASTMDLTVSFSTDTGAEDRTGFEDVMSELLGGEGLIGFDEAAQQTEEQAQGPDVTSVGEQPATPAQNQPAATPSASTPMPAPAAAPMQSPLVG